jgi:hypothetical protein
MTATNPLSQIKAAIRAYMGAHWDSLPDDNPAKVKVGNRFRRNVRDQTQPADLPEVDFRSGEGGVTRPFASSSSGQFVRAWELGIAGDDHNSGDTSLDQAEWELIRCAAKMQIELLGLNDLIVKVEIDNTRQTKDDAELNRGHRTWSGAVTLIVTFQVKRSDIIPTV